MFSTSLVCNMSLRLSSWLLSFLSIFAPSGILWGQTPISGILNVAAASDLSVIGPELKVGFESQNPGVRIRLVNGSSAMLAQQISQGAPFDVFLSANAGFVERLASNRKIDPGSIRGYATGRLGLAWRDGQHHPIRELTTSGIKVVALPNPKLAPYGIAAQQALEYGGLWLAVQPKVVYGENVRQALQFLESGNADAVITSDALLQNRTADTIPEDWHKPILQKAGIVSKTGNRKLAAHFLTYLLSPEGQAIFARFGFGPKK